MTDLSYILITEFFSSFLSSGLVLVGFVFLAIHTFLLVSNLWPYNTFCSLL